MEVQDEKFNILKIEIVNNVLLIHTANKSDSVLFVCENLDIIKCFKTKQKISNFKLNKVPYIITNKDTIYFTYKIKDSNNQNSILSSQGKPWKTKKNRVIYSYKSFPYLVNDCSRVND